MEELVVVEVVDDRGVGFMPPKMEDKSSSKRAGSRPASKGFGRGFEESISSRKPSLQLGHERAEVGDGVIVTVRSHWWQK